MNFDAMITSYLYFLKRWMESMYMHTYQNPAEFYLYIKTLHCGLIR